MKKTKEPDRHGLGDGSCHGPNRSQPVRARESRLPRRRAARRGVACAIAIATFAIMRPALAQHAGHDHPLPALVATKPAAPAVPAAVPAAATAPAASTVPAAATAPAAMSAPDTRQPVDFPPALKAHELANMRDHLVTIANIQELLSRKEFDKAGDLAEKRLGMSSFGLHGAHQVAPFMPKGMQELGGAMHRAASRFAVATQDAAVDQDLAKAIGALNQVTQACVACHAGYRLN